MRATSRADPGSMNGVGRRDPRHLEKTAAEGCSIDQKVWIRTLEDFQELENP